MSQTVMNVPCSCEKCQKTVTSMVTASAALVTEETAERYLRVNDGNQMKAAHRLTKSLVWRSQFIDDNLCDDLALARSAAVARFCPSVLHDRQDRQGHAIKVIRLGMADPSAADLPDVFRGESAQVAFLRHHVWLNEKATLGADQQPGNKQRLSIIDLTNLSLRHLQRSPMRVLRAMIESDGRHYPGLLFRCYVVNAGVLLQMVWPLIKSWLDEQTLSRVRVLGSMSDPANRAVICEDIAEADLPPFLGPRASAPGLNAAGRDGVLATPAP